MNRKQLFEQIQAKKSMLCVGLDVDFNKMPEHVKALAGCGETEYKGELYKGTARSILEFNKAIVDATAAHCVAYKPNLAFYECYGIDGMRALDATVDYIGQTILRSSLLRTPRGETSEIRRRCTQRHSSKRWISML